MSQVHVKRKRADWSDKNLGIFLKVCVEEVRAGNRPHTHFTRTGWANIQAKFNNATKLAYDYKKFKNKWDHLKVDWALWTKLNAIESGLGWDATKRTVAASDEWWEAKIKESPEVGKFRDEGLKFFPEMEILFKGVVATGLAAYAPSEDSRDSHGQSIGVEESFDADIDEAETEEHGIEVEMTAQPSSSRGNGQRKRGREGEKKVGDAANLSSQLERVINSFESSDPGSKNDPANINACVERLKNLPGLTRGSDLFYTGISLMDKRENRLIFLSLEEPTLQLGWIKSKHK
ncbi:L10-interacting MYB domain-containing protein-like [Lotus japonicus]|uniref:L10-interacting MYB domain-containing protein-like n=1 Tax=Lotus japonicus TaxID=34305 RepID=UPI0025853289|nr:L10-interacting MYB domain-containing protein-like [Lotus japonicus]